MALCPCWMKVLSLDAFFFLITLVVVALRSCWMTAWSLDAFFLNHLVVVALCPCWMKVLSLGTCFLNHIGRCGLMFLLDAGLVIGYMFS